MGEKFASGYMRRGLCTIIHWFSGCFSFTFIAFLGGALSQPMSLLRAKDWSTEDLCVAPFFPSMEAGLL